MGKFGFFLKKLFGVIFILGGAYILWIYFASVKANRDAKDELTFLLILGVSLVVIGPFLLIRIKKKKKKVVTNTKEEMTESVLANSSSNNATYSFSDKDKAHYKYVNGYNLVEGKGVPKNVQKGIKLLKESAAEGSDVANCQLGYYYYFGKNVKKDTILGFHYYKKAVEMKNKDAIFDLGYIYFNGVDIKQDINKGWEMLKKAASLGNSKAIQNIAYYSFYGKM